MTTINDPRSRPVMPGERISELDVLRGFALFGVLLAYALWNLGSPPESEYTQFDRIANKILLPVIDQKFYTLFAFLFGLGFSIQLARAGARGTSVVPVYCRRLLVLLLFGLAHALLLRNGDILAPYAIIGFLLLLFRNASNGTLLIAGIASLAFPAIAQLLLRDIAAIQFVPRPRTPGMSYLAGNFEWVRHWYSRGLFNWTPFLSLFVLGLYAGRSRFFEHIGEHRKLLWRLTVFGLAIGISAYFALEPITAFWTTVSENRWQNFSMRLVWTFVSTAHSWGLATFYASSLLLLLQKPGWRKAASPLSAVGRMALTNYLLQAATIVPVCLMFGLFDNVTPTIGIALAVVVWSIQVPASVVWLKHFDFGPAEWLWRSLTYWQAQPMRARVHGENTA